MIRQEPCNGVEFMIAHCRNCTSGFDHPANQIDGFNLVRTSVDKIPNKYCLPRWMAPRSPRFSIAKTFEKLFEGFCMSVNVADDIETH